MDATEDARTAQRRDLRPAPAAAPAADDFVAASAELRAALDETCTVLRRSASTARPVPGLEAFDASSFRLGILVCLAVTVTALVLAAALVLVAGAQRGLDLWTHEAWWSGVVLGAAIVALLALATRFVRRLAHHAFVVRLKHVFAHGRHRPLHAHTGNHLGNPSR